MSGRLGCLLGSRPETPGAEMSFIDHLEELRSVLLASLATVFVLGVGGWYVSSWVMDTLVRHAGLEGAQAIKPQEIFLTRFKISVVLGILAGLPYIAMRVWGFVVPGLLQRERRVVFPLVFWSTLLFLLGTAFGVMALSPIMLGFLAGFATDVVQVNPAVSQVLDFYIFTGLACGLVFQLPLVVAIVTYFGLISPPFLTRYWRHAVVVILIIAAVLTPPDVISQLAMGVPIIVLYFVSILVSHAVHRARRRPADWRSAWDARGAAPAGEPPAAVSPAAVSPVATPPAEKPFAAPPRAAGSVEVPPHSVPLPAAPPSAVAPAEEVPRAASPAEGAATASNGPAEQPRPLHPPDQDWTI